MIKEIFAYCYLINDYQLIKNLFEKINKQLYNTI